MSAPVYRLRFFFDAGSGECLWAGNAAAKERFGYPVDLSELPIGENLRRYLFHLAAWYDTAIDWNYPPNPSPWTKDEWDRFLRAVDSGIARLREKLGGDFEIVVEYGGWRAG